MKPKFKKGDIIMLKSNLSLKYKIINIKEKYYDLEYEQYKIMRPVSFVDQYYKISLKRLLNDL